MTVKENASLISDNAALILDLSNKLSGVPGHEDLKLIVDRVDEIFNQLEKTMITVEKIIKQNIGTRDELVQFKRDCGQDLLQLKRKVNYLDSIQRRDDRSRY